MMHRNIFITLAVTCALLLTFLSIPAAVAYSSYGYSYTGYPTTYYRNIGSEYRPDGYGLVRQDTAYPRYSYYIENNRFVGHRSNWDGRSAYYSGFTGQTRLQPYRREANQLYNYGSYGRYYGGYGYSGYRSAYNGHYYYG